MPLPRQPSPLLYSKDKKPRPLPSPTCHVPLLLILISAACIVIGVTFAVVALRRPTKTVTVFRCGLAEDTVKTFRSRSGGEQVLADRPKLLGVVGVITGFGRAALRSTRFPSDPDGLLSEEVQVGQLAATRELQEVEEEIFHLPYPKAKRSPRVLKRRGPRKQPSVIDEFLDESSELRPFFFPDQKMAIDLQKEGNDSMYYYPGRLWLDTDGNPIQAHEGGLMFDEKTETYYWYGENKDG